MEEERLELVLGMLACLSVTPSNLGWHLLLPARSWQRGSARPFCSHPRDPPLWRASRKVIRY